MNRRAIFLAHVPRRIDCGNGRLQPQLLGIDVASNFFVVNLGSNGYRLRVRGIVRPRNTLAVINRRSQGARISRLQFLVGQTLFRKFFGWRLTEESHLIRDDVIPFTTC